MRPRGGQLRCLFDLESRAGLTRRPFAQDELELDTVLYRRLALEDPVPASYGNRITLASSIGTNAAQVGKEIIRVGRAGDPDAEGHPVHTFDVPVFERRKHRLRRHVFNL
jgi:hypothetical protein